jgi:hypothetical protein
MIVLVANKSFMRSKLKKKHFKQLSIWWKTALSWDRQIIRSFDILKNQKFCWSHAWSKKLSISWKSIFWTPVIRSRKLEEIIKIKKQIIKLKKLPI